MACIRCQTGNKCQHKNFLTISFALTPCTLTPLNSLCTLIDYSAITSTFSTAHSGDDEVVIKQLLAPFDNLMEFFNARLLSALKMPIIAKFDRGWFRQEARAVSRLNDLMMLLE